MRDTVSRRQALAVGGSLAAAAVLPRPVFLEAGAADALPASLAEAADALKARRTSSLELTRGCLARVERDAARLNAFVTVTAAQALARAEALDAELRRGVRRSPLHGIPIGLKDNIDTAGVRTTAASAVFADRIPSQDAEVVRRLDAAGAVFVGKLNLHEFAFGGGAVSYYGPMRNPWNPLHVAGGSSGGSGIAVALSMCYAALGTDTGGSIRDPANNCGIVGLKPTYGRVSNRGVLPLCWSLDHVGPLTRTVEDAALVLQAIAGYDPSDVSSVDVAVPDYVAALGKEVGGLRIGVPRAMFFDNLDAEVAAAVEKALSDLRALGVTVKDMRLPPISSIPWDALYLAEIGAYHAQLFKQLPGSYQPATRKTLQAASSVSAFDYVVARRELQRLRREIGGVFEEVDLLAAPTAPYPARTIEEELRRAESQKPFPPELHTEWQFNVFGTPTISVPCGFTAQGLPMGIQFSGPHFAEARVLALAHAYERATPWHQRQPPSTTTPG